ncbi:phosphate/phosphite/phosphonate ABC transporter substrate-binding protein [Rubrobacter indicoceani]|uniref:phosphate/phosphite/phosphonate ABC transporter substrate-binding protein n=1 Tax=Rubrobacter indicoceani TaxID=2051957 RepID=UPI0013C4B6AD|nr:phosphate/phosphite/phosphonate ABC transporter substrate-binding protein [Rubrobacter indicoceani]
MKKFLGPLAAVVVVVVVGGCGGGASGEDVLRIGLIPNQAPDEVEAEYQPLGDYMSEELDREVELFVPTGYPAVVEAMANDEIDLALFGGLTYVQARERAEVSPLVTDINPRIGNTTYRSVIVVPSDSDIGSVNELEGADFAFGSVSSTSGSLYPSIMLNEAGIDYRTDLGEFTYTGGHDATAAAVASGNVDAGGLEYRILLDLEEEGTIEPGSVRVIERSDPVEGYPWVVRDALPEETRDEIADAFLNIDDEELLSLLNSDGYERVEAADYDYVEEQARQLDLLTES